MIDFKFTICSVHLDMFLAVNFRDLLCVLHGTTVDSAWAIGTTCNCNSRITKRNLVKRLIKDDLQAKSDPASGLEPNIPQRSHIKCYAVIYENKFSNKMTISDSF